MPGKRYEMNAPRWPVSGRRFAAMPCDAPFPGVVSLTILEDVAEQIAVPSPSGRLVIVDEGFHWIQLAPRDEPWWLTAMFDAERALVQFYFDLAFENHILPRGESWCRDAYLDVVMDPGGECRILDADELAAAETRGEITAAQADTIRAAADALVRRFSGESNRLEALCRGYLDALLTRLPK